MKESRDYDDVGVMFICVMTFLVGLALGMIIGLADCKESYHIESVSNVN